MRTVFLSSTATLPYKSLTASLSSSLFPSLPPSLPPREGRVMGIVEVSRSIGDGRFKLCGVISVPDVLRCQLTDNDM